MNALGWPKKRMHLAWCEYCGKRIAWSRRRRQWLALTPLMTPGLTQLARRMVCATTLPTTPRTFHDPAVSA